MQRRRRFLSKNGEQELEQQLLKLQRWAHLQQPGRTRRGLLGQARATRLAFLIMHSPGFSHRTEKARQHFWRKGHWPQMAKRMPGTADQSDPVSRAGLQPRALDFLFVRVQCVRSHLSQKPRAGRT
jgi:hypothetical protein